MERTEINPCLYGQSIFDKGGKNMQWGEDSISDYLVSLFEIHHWYLDRNCIESIDCCASCGHFNDVNSSYLGKWYMLPLICIF